MRLVSERTDEAEELRTGVLNEAFQEPNIYALIDDLQEEG